MAESSTNLAAIFGAAPTDAVIASAKITDISLAEWRDERHNHAIQSNAFTTLEVILAAGWSYPADIWNLGVMLGDLKTSACSMLLTPDPLATALPNISA